MSSIVAEGARLQDGIVAATHKLVQQAMTGQWQLMPQTVQERRELLDNLSASASPQDRQWLGALQQAMAESDAAVAQMYGNAPAEASARFDTQAQAQGTVANGVVDTPDSAAVNSMLELLKQSR